ncbi:MAG TPA: aspartate--tRNA ligase [Acidimicrobiales bacterium]|nr:aspartate--tRNA ligase [Acidimicrobiales bacterium]
MSMRSHHCGELTSAEIGAEVSVCGWVARRREHGEHLAFVDVRDHTGIIQCVVDGAHDLRGEYVVRVTGTVRARPEGTVNAALPTGEVEVGDCAVEILNAAEPPPFPVTDRVEADETVRLRHRYVDLRRDRMQRNLRLRARLNSALRVAIEKRGFIEVETPMLIASTPEGARDFVVPARQKPGTFYSLPQSPQLFKQLLMVGGIDRYYQLARCLRDEDLRADRQFEFIQFDAEMAFAGQTEVQEVIGGVVAEATGAVTGQAVAEIPTITWIDAQERFGSDKPDLRYGMELVELTPVFAATEFRAFQADCVKGIKVDGGAEFGRNKLDALTDLAKSYGAKGLVWMRVLDDGLDSPVAKFLTDDEQKGLRAAMDAATGDLLLLVADERAEVRRVLGLLRVHLAALPVNEGGFHFSWVTEFPLFEGIDERGFPIAAHHLFTMPHSDDLELVMTDPLKVRSQSYDLVLNGWELGSGSVRIHRPDIQQLVFSAVGIEPAEAQERFGFLLDAFRFGAPPHAGYAFGVDRLAAILAGEENIREIIAFPKTQSGADPLTGAPTPIEPAQLTELGLRLLPPPEKKG